MEAIDWILNKLEEKITVEVESEIASGPVPIREFVKSPDYLGLDYFWEKPLLELEELRKPGCLGGVVEKGIGGGKSFTISILPLYDIYCLACEEIIQGKDPRERFSLARDMVIYAAVFTVTSKLAREIFRYMQGFAANCPWFQKHLPINPDLTSELHFLHPETKDVRYIAYPGHSKVSSSIGRNIFSFILDECNFFQVTEGSASSSKDYAEDLYEQLEDRVRSSFGLFGYAQVVSSRLTVHDFSARLKRKLEDSENASKYYLPAPKTSWDDWPSGKNEANQWKKFDKATLRWIGEPVDYQAAQLDEGFHIPETFWGSFSTDPEKALKNLASIPSEALEPFFRIRSRIYPDYDMQIPLKKSTMPEDWMVVEDFDDLVEEWMHGHPDYIYHFHVDLARKWDACGISVSTCSGIEDIVGAKTEGKLERAALIDTELMILIRARAGQEIEFSRVRDILYWLVKDRGFKMRRSSFDGWQSDDSIQILRRMGFDMDVLSVDRDLEPYTTMKDALYEGRWFFHPAHGQTNDTTYQEICRMADGGDPSAVLQRELAQLEIINGKKVDHPPNGSKDMADSACGSITQVTRFMRKNKT